LATIPVEEHGGLLHPGRKLCLVELVAFVDGEVARVLVPGDEAEATPLRKATLM